MKVSLVSLGCSRTLVDSEAALGGLKKDGYEIVSDVRKADVAIVNTCGFIEEAKKESIETILGLCELKRKGKLSAVVVLGCLAQRYGQELAEELAEVDGVIGTDNYGNLADLLKPLREKKEKVFQVKAKPRYLVDENTPRVTLTPEHFSYLKISEGCLNACSYCVIPQMKGAHRSRPLESILSEIKNITSERNISEINLIGQDTAAYGYDHADRTFKLPKLLKAIVKLDLVPWVRFLYAHPGHVSDELIDTVAANPSICRYIDFPIEHSHDAMLKRMNRGVDRAKMEWGIGTLRKKIPGITIRTTVIVGFPGETEEEFQDLMEFLKDTRFERLGAFIYSHEEGSRSYAMKDVLPRAVKEERFNAVMTQQREISTELNQGLIGASLVVLIDEKEKGQNHSYLGRTQGDAPEVDNLVVVQSQEPLKAGQFVNARVTDALEYDLIADFEGRVS